MIVTILGWMIHIGEFLIAANLLMLLMPAFVRQFRGFNSGLLFTSTGIWALTLIVWCAVTVYSGWGWSLTILGLVLGGAGIVPVAFLCLLLNKEWLELLELAFQGALIIGGYYTARRLMAEKSGPAN